MAPSQCLRNALIAALMVVANLSSLVESTVSYGGHTYESMPSHFGMVWTPAAKTYQAHLQFLPDRPKLCEEGFEGEGIEGLQGLVLPNDTLPVALLVERGNCSFEEKAMVAMQAYPAVSFLVVYDEQPSKNLVSMRETYTGNGVTLGMLFVSFHAGMSLRSALNNQTVEILDGGGPIIQLDGLDPLMLHEPSLKDLQTWILIAMGGFFTFITVFGCLLVFVQLGVIPVSATGQIILSQDALRRARRLLTREEVARFQHGGDLHGKCATSDAEIETQPTEETPTEAGNAEDNGGEATNSGDVNLHVDPEEDQCCAVCLDELTIAAAGEEDNGHSTLCLPCNHNFHVECIIPWLTERHATCPLCKFDLLEYIMELDADTTTNNSRTSFSWFKKQGRRLMGWSAVPRSSDSQSDSATTNSEDGEMNTDVPTEVPTEVPTGVTPI